jgi:hypothetical protein
MSIASLGHNNVNAVIADLLKMNNAQRQQFAQHHADDPLMLSAAKFVDNKIKEQAQAYLAQQNGTAPPKVNAQVVQSMGPQTPQPQPQVPQPQAQPQGQPQAQPQAQPQPQAAQALPENSGIAQLPAQNIQKMAGGGIVAFATGGVPEGAIVMGNMYKDPETGLMKPIPDTDSVPFGNVYTDPNTGEEKYVSGGPQARSGYEGMSLGDAASKLGTAAKQKLENMFISGDYARKKLTEQRNAAKEAEYGPNQQGYRPRTPNAQSIAEAAAAASAAPTPYGAGAGRGTGGAPAPKVVSADVLAERLAAGKAAASNKPPAMPTMKTTSDSDILATYKRIQEQQNPDVTVDPYAAQTEANRADAASLGQRQLSDAAAREQGLAGLFSKREGRIQEREGRIQSSEDLNTKMAIINAGLAMMQSTGKGLAGIAEGATVGAKQYAEGMKASELARQKIEDAKDAFDELRFNQEGMTAKEKTAAIGTITNASIFARNAAVKNMQDKQGLTEKRANTLFDKTMEANLQAEREKGATARAAFSAQVQREIAQMPGATERMYATLGGGNVKKGFEYFTSATAEGKGDEAIMQAVIKSPELLGAVSPEVRKAVEQKIMERFVPGTVPGKAVPAAQVRAP